MLEVDRTYLEEMRFAHLLNSILFAQVALLHGEVQRLRVRLNFDEETFFIDGLRFDVRAADRVFFAGRMINVSSIELGILKKFATTPEPIVAKEALDSLLPGKEYKGRGSMPMHISRLRRKMSYAGDFFIPVRKVGWRFRDEDQTTP